MLYSMPDTELGDLIHRFPDYTDYADHFKSDGNSTGFNSPQLGVRRFIAPPEPSGGAFLADRFQKKMDV